MRKNLLIAVLMLLSFSMFAQNIIQVQEAGVRKDLGQMSSSVKVPTDTIFIDDFFNLGQPSIYGYNPLGYIFGTAWDTAGNPKAPEVAQGYIMNFTGGYNIEEVLVWVADKSQTSGTGSNMTVKIAKINGTSTYGPSGGPTNTISCPNTVMGTAVVDWADIDSGANINDAITIATFNPPVYVNTDYAVVLNFDNFYTNNDTIGVVCSEDGGASLINGIEYTWWKYRTTSGSTFWAQLSHIFNIAGTPMDVGIAIFPIVNASAGIVDGSNNFINGLQLGQNSPNPAVTGTSIPYSIEKAANVKMEIFDTKGNLVKTIDEGMKNAGSYEIYLTNELASGTYYYSLNAGGNRLTKKLTFTK